MSFIGVLLMAATAPSANHTPPCRIIETVHLIKNGQSRAVVEGCLGTENSPRLRIYSRRGTLTIQPEGGLVSVQEGLQRAHDVPPNALQSNWLYEPRDFGVHGRTTIMLFGYAFASDPGSLRVLQVRSDGRPEIVFSDDTFDVDSLRRRPQGFLLTGHRSLSQTSSKCTATYDPASVVQVGFNGKAVYSASLSRHYNIASGYVWAGPKSREDIGVNTCSKPARVVTK